MYYIMRVLNQNTTSVQVNLEALVRLCSSCPMIKPIPMSAILIASLKTNSGKMLITENTTTVYAAY